MKIDLESLLPLGMQGVFYVLLFVFLVHTLILAFHWFTYGISKHVSTIALALYLGGGAVLFLSLSFALRLI